MMTSPNKSLRQVQAAASAGLEKKAQNLVLLDLTPETDFTDYFLICNGSSNRQVQAISTEIERQLRSDGLRPAHIEGYNQAEWILMDYVDFVVHIFSKPARDFYDLEQLWQTAPALPIPHQG
jgi:ribosome-associated protein